MMGHNIHFKGIIWKINQNYPFYPFLYGALVIVKMLEQMTLENNVDSTKAGNQSFEKKQPD